jgi:hypothetical protein
MALRIYICHQENDEMSLLSISAMMLSAHAIILHAHRVVKNFSGTSSRNL